ncbi:hypothetical protein Q3O60_06375 [Alkalimonas collagenimarina]|uniref:Uncharacterized protein n=1 Tax=Alkalimonas collagenimarina TaxID=400390 RepID=A0ABT9GXL8_9GAMM|nr:hypothetical protein [Alkalimonas collagenimarina]MDP4535805.1 hypothetical protein [Alkalimonas collagenimarina]
MEMIVKLDSLGLGIPKTGFGVNLISGSYIQVKYGPNKPFKTYGIANLPSIGGDNATIIYGTLQTKPINLNIEEFQAFSLTNMTGKHIDIEVSGTVLGSGRADLTISLIDDAGRAQTVVERKNIPVIGGQIASTKVRGRARYIAH